MIQEPAYFAAGEPPEVQESILYLYEEVEAAIRDRIWRVAREQDFSPSGIVIDWDRGEMAVTAAVHLRLRFVSRGGRDRDHWGDAGLRLTTRLRPPPSLTRRLTRKGCGAWKGRPGVALKGLTVATVVLNPDELKPLVREIVQAVLAESEQLNHLLTGKLAVTEPEAAALLALNAWQLRDLRLAGKITHSRIVGGRIRYTLDDLVGYLRRTREAGISTGR